LYVAGRIHHLTGDFEEAKMYLIKAYELEKLPDVQNLLGLCYLELGNYEQAKTIFLNMYEKLPLNVNVLLSIAKCCERLGQNDEAISYAEKLVEHFEECEEAHELIRRLS
jgi:tetratricopeptide (TPR) repeat protein